MTRAALRLAQRQAYEARTLSGFSLERTFPINVGGFPKESVPLRRIIRHQKTGCLMNVRGAAQGAARESIGTEVSMIW